MVHTRCELFSVFRRVTLASRASYRYLAVAKYDLYVSRRGFLRYECMEKKKKESFEGDNKFEKYKFCHDLKGLKGRLIQIFSKFSDGRNTSSSSESFFEIDSSSQRITRDGGIKLN